MTTPEMVEATLLGESTVRILGFTYGSHQDAAGYGRRAETTLAIIAMPDGRVTTVPTYWLRLTALRAPDER